MRKQLNRWLIFSVGLVLVALAAGETLIGVINRDGTGITLGILSIFVLCHFAVARAITDGTDEFVDKIVFVAEFMVALGLIGTVTGFMMLFGDSFNALDVSDQASIAAVISDMAAGLGTALVTTLFGLIGRWTIIGELKFLLEE